MKIEKTLMAVGFVLVCIFGCAMDSESMLVPIIGVLAGCALLGIGELKWYISQK